MSRHLATRQNSATAQAVARLKKITGLALDPLLLQLAEKWRMAQDVPPSKTAVHETALREFLQKRGIDTNPRSTSPTKNSSGKR